jgi:hypothetical protein
MTKTVLVFLILSCSISGMAISFDGINYNQIGITHNLSVAAYNFKSGGSISIPSTIDYEDYSWTVTAIGDWAFYNCDAVTSITVPQSVTYIGSNAFDNCSSMTIVNVPAAVTEIGSGAFTSCTSLETLEIPMTVSKLGDWAFGECKSLKSFKIPTSISTIGGYTFYNCLSLTTITIPCNINAINQFAFGNCTGLTSIHCNALTPPTLENTYAFYNVNKSIPVYIPIGTLAAYQTQFYYLLGGWGGFTNFIEESVNNNNCVSTVIEENNIQPIRMELQNDIILLSGIKSGTSVRVFNMQGKSIIQQEAKNENLQIKLPSHGIYLINVEGKNMKVSY